MTGTDTFKISTDDEGGADLGFVLSCLALGMITMDELHEWVRHVINTLPRGQVPAHLVAMLSIKKRAALFRPSDSVMERIPHDPFITDDRFDAMLALHYFLRPDRTEFSALTREEAEANLRRNPEVADRFFDLFPFLTDKAA